MKGPCLSSTESLTQSHSLIMSTGVSDSETFHLILPAQPDLRASTDVESVPLVQITHLLKGISHAAH